MCVGAPTGVLVRPTHGSSLQHLEIAQPTHPTKQLDKITELFFSHDRYGTHTRSHFLETATKSTGHLIRDLIATVDTHVHDAHGRNARHVQVSTLDSHNFPCALVLQQGSWYDQRHERTGALAIQPSNDVKSRDIGFGTRLRPRTLACTMPTDITHGTLKIQRWIPTITRERWCSKIRVGTTNAR